MPQTSGGIAPSATSTAPATRAWLAVAALGAGLLHLATGAGATLPALVALVFFGGAEVVWSLACLARDRAPAARLVVYAALLPVGCWAAIATVGAGSGVSPAFAALPAFPLLVASALDVAIAMTLAVSIRRAARGRGSARASAGRFVAGLLVSAAAVTLVTVPALAMTGPGAQAVNVHLLHEGGHHH
ncbi:hypothetical protein G3T36_04950 [Diaminobutyricibacter tongyongensis]|uniref:Uncharacterized protein n=1 Tax=Leifsonia tongyongensis TaxID=1268043 RepID=A0A6L9XW04_9MICO|nr:hypothetical protein [Diaminobutyricibacter tongyongensis]NEN05214.1 hypothetical protein [Diaminobutyricibacter tongyongensis]